MAMFSEAPPNSDADLNEICKIFADINTCTKVIKFDEE